MGTGVCSLEYKCIESTDLQHMGVIVTSTEFTFLASTKKKKKDRTQFYHGFLSKDNKMTHNRLLDGFFFMELDLLILSVSRNKTVHEIKVFSII